ncbi:MAG: hypothetical protein KDA93_07935 [Planctomycetaceae bacterium]|nr:hypothetical protein [Planctomycetaceae bacterium]
MTRTLMSGLLFVLLSPATVMAASPIDLSKATIVTDSSSPVVAKAAVMLQEELAERSGITLPIAKSTPADCVIIRLGTSVEIPDVNVPRKPESYGVAVRGKEVLLVGHDARGALYAAGRLIRLATYRPGVLTLTLDQPIASSPDVAVRAHQLAYRNTANTYDAWTIEMYEQYIRDMIMFGCNGVEIISGLNADAKDGPVMTQTVRSMNVALSELVHSYGIDLWVWSPVMATPGEDVTTPEGVERALEQRRGFLKDYPVIDHLFVPGGDDGNTPAVHLMPFLEKFSVLLKELHPNAKIWVSNQTFTLEENDYFFGYLAESSPDWLEGLVYGPWIKMGWEEMRERTPARYPIRRYPDINHTVRCQYPIPNWDQAFAHTLGREPVMPMPDMQAHIYRKYLEVSDGFGTYSDGIHDDLNKHVWNVLGWDPDADMDVALEEYGKVWFGDALAKDVAQGLRGLEANWKGPVLENTGIPKTLAMWEDIAKRVPDFEENWRAQMYLFRARFDANVQAEARAQKEYQAQAHAALAEASQIGVSKAIDRARAALNQADQPAAPELRSSIEALGPFMLKSIGYQLSVEPPYLARNSERGAMLDWLDQPLNDRRWLEQRFDSILALGNATEQLAHIDTILHWEDPGPGGFYDNLGTLGAYSHVVFQRSWEEDPSGSHSPRVAFPNYKADAETIAEQAGGARPDELAFKEEVTRVAGAYKGRQELRTSWQSQIATLYGTPLKMRYEGLDPDAQYRLKVTYAGRFRPSMTLTLNDEYGIHGPVPQPNPIWPVSYHLPRAATQSGTLDVEWNLVDGRGCMVAEVWLIKMDEAGQ